MYTTYKSCDRVVEAWQFTYKNFNNKPNWLTNKWLVDKIVTYEPKYKDHMILVIADAVGNNIVRQDDYIVLIDDELYVIEKHVFEIVFEPVL